MKKQTLTILITAFITSVIFISIAFADNGYASDKPIHEADINGYHFVYQLIDMKEKMKAMKGMEHQMEGMKGMEHQMEGMTGTHHLMVFIKTAQGEPVVADKVGFLVTGPGEDQKMMTMGMDGGYGADINLSLPGEYSVKTKAIIGGQSLVDSFTYTIKEPQPK